MIKEPTANNPRLESQTEVGACIKCEAIVIDQEHGIKSKYDPAGRSRRISSAYGRKLKDAGGDEIGECDAALAAFVGSGCAFSSVLLRAA